MANGMGLAWKTPADHFEAKTDQIKHASKVTKKGWKDENPLALVHK